MSVPFAAGALYSTVDDLYRWDAALFNRTFAAGDSIKEMFTPQVTSCDELGTICSAPDCDAQRINCYSYGYGWYLAQFPVGSQYVHVNWHSGGIQGFVSLNLYYPDQELTLIVLSNLEAFNWTLITNAVQSILIRQLL
jgi:CubicO group peptidase (beta-lactamase class C family)